MYVDSLEWILTIILSQIIRVSCVDRIYYIAHEEVSWDPVHGLVNSTKYGDSTQRRTIFFEYTDTSFSVRKDRPVWLGNVGAVIKAEVGDRIVVNYLYKSGNAKHRTTSLHPVGLSYNKANEGSVYPYYARIEEEKSGTVRLAEIYQYLWEVMVTDGPGEHDPHCVSSTYFSDTRGLRQEIDSGNIGFLLICKQGVLGNEEASGIQQQFFLYFSSVNSLFTINGYQHDSLSDIWACQGDRSIWHFMSMGGIDDIRTVSVSGHAMLHKQHNLWYLPLYPGRTASVVLVAGHVGEWQITSNVPKEQAGGMNASFTIKDCGHYINSPWVNGVIRRYYIAANEEYWNHGTGISRKILYREYSDKTFTYPKQRSHREQHLGTLGPIIRAEVGDLIKVFFFNNASKPVSILPSGVDDQRYIEDRSVHPNEFKTFYWTVPKNMGPAYQDPPCLTYIYKSDVDLSDVSSGLIGPLLVCRHGELQSEGLQKQVTKEYFLYFHLLNESTYYMDGNYDQEIVDDYYDEYASETENMVYSINGYFNGTVPGIGVCKSENISWHLIAENGMSRSVHVLHFEDTDIRVPLFPGATETVLMFKTASDLPGLTDHVQMGGARSELMLMFNTSSCSIKSQLPYSYLEYRTYYILIKKMFWSYSPDQENKHRYTKLTYQETVDKRHQRIRRKPENLKFLGSVIVTHPGETIKIVLRNKGQKNHSIYVDGIDRFTESGQLVMKGDAGVSIEGSRVFIWKIPESFGPIGNEPECKAYMYYSDVDEVRDINSGLFGPLLVCRKSPKNEYDISRMKILLFATINEGSSWFKTEDEADRYYRAMNGYMDNQMQDDMTTSDVLHLLCIGEFFSIHFHGLHITRFTNNTDRHLSYSWRADRNIIDLYPGNTETVTIQFYETQDNWLIRNLIFDKDLEGVFKNIGGDLS
ncbi:hypothetical protein ScPMuIL_001549 [Solemya velum]